VKKVRMATVVSVGLLMLGVLAAGSAEAVIVSPLNCTFSGGVCSSVSSLGTITFTTVADASDSGTNVQIVVDLATDTQKVLEVFLNTTLLSDPGLTVSGDASTLTFSLNGVNEDGCVGCFDIAIPGTGNIGTTNTATLLLDAGNTALTESTFFVVNSANVDAGVHIGEVAVFGSLFAGETPETSVPEPTSLLLLGSGLVGLSAWAWRRNRR